MSATLSQSQSLALDEQLGAIPSLETGTTITCRNPFNNLDRVRAMAASLAPMEALYTQEASHVAVLPRRLLLYHGQGP